MFYTVKRPATPLVSLLSVEHHRLKDAIIQAQELEFLFPADIFEITAQRTTIKFDLIYKTNEKFFLSYMIGTCRNIWPHTHLKFLHKIIGAQELFDTMHPHVHMIVEVEFKEIPVLDWTKGF